ncbi:hypothetical protein AB1N83_003628 [Pleurotus pulmonarius]
MLDVEQKYQPQALPSELIEEIIAVAANSGPTPREVSQFLAAGSLVSRIWNIFCRPYIFHTITISFRDANARLSFLHFQAPYLSQHIRTLDLHFWPSHRFLAEEWLPECLGRLTNLRVLRFEPERSFNLLRAPALLTAGIMTILFAPHLRKLVLRGWTFVTDASDLLSMLSPTLEELVIWDVSVRDAAGKGSTTIRLEALRSLGLINVSHPLLGFGNFFECPNLQSLVARWPRFHEWDVPLWLPDSLSELRLRATHECNIPNFERVVKPSIVVIDLGSHDSFLPLFTWSTDCINRLPFPNSIQRLTLNIERNFLVQGHTEGPYPEVSDYTLLARCLRQLVELGALRSINLNIKVVEVLPTSDDLAIDEPRELAKLKIGFAALLEANVLNVDLVLQGSEDGDLGTAAYFSL